VLWIIVSDTLMLIIVPNKFYLYIITVVPFIHRGVLNPWLPENADSTEPCIYYAFSYTYILLISLTYKLGTVRD